MTRLPIPFADFVADPLGALARGREAGGFADLEVGVGVLAHDDVRALLADPRLRANFPSFLESFGVTEGPFHEWMSMSPLNHDGAEHQDWRSVLSRTFTPKRVERIRPFLRDAAHTLIDEFAPRGNCEFMAEFADAYPSLGLCELIGVPSEDRERFRGWANMIGLGFSPVGLAERIGEIDAALVELLAYTRQLAATRRTEPRDDLVTRIAEAADQDGWDDDRVAATIAGLVFAGHETTKNQLGWMIAVLAEQSGIWDAVAAGTLAVADVVEETIRYRSTVTSVGRRAAESIECGSDRIEAGEQVLLSLWSADHDGAVYPHPDELNVTGNTEPHLAFGHGAHHCIGAALARAELQDALAALTARLECPRVADGATWKPPIGINGPDTLPITFAARP